MTSELPIQANGGIRTEAVWVLTYFALYLGYLAITLENEIAHWLSLVVIPFAALFLFQNLRIPSWRLSTSLRTVGLEKSRSTNGIVWAIVIGLALSGLQFVLSRSRDQIWALFVSGKALYLFPMSLVLMLFTAGFTEEFFFRGVLQTRLQSLLRSNVMAVVVTSMLFGLYHLPYAYLNPRWPSQGNWPEALGAAFGQGVPMGLILGTVYVRSKNNLAACVLVHALVNSLPGMLWVAHRMTF